MPPASGARRNRPLEASAKPPPVPTMARKRERIARVGLKKTAAWVSKASMATKCVHQIEDPAPMPVRNSHPARIAPCVSRARWNRRKLIQMPVTQMAAASATRKGLWSTTMQDRTVYKVCVSPSGAHPSSRVRTLAAPKDPNLAASRCDTAQCAVSINTSL